MDEFNGFIFCVLLCLLLFLIFHIGLNGFNGFIFCVLLRLLLFKKIFVLSVLSVGKKHYVIRWCQEHVRPFSPSFPIFVS